MTRLLVFGDAGQTGFGTVTGDLGKALIALGDDPRFVSFNESAVTDAGELPEPFRGRTLTVGVVGGWLGFASSEEEALRILDRIRSMFTAEPWADGWSPEAVIAIGDAASFISAPIADLVPDGMPAFHYVPIEGIDIPPRWALAWRKFRPVAMSEFGADQIATIYPERPPVAYHGVDSEAFYPVSSTRPIVVTDTRGVRVLRSKEDCKRFFGRDPGEVWLFRADRNMPRKRYASLFRAVAPLLAKYPKLHLFMHCRTNDQGGNLDDERSKFHPDIQARMMVTGFHDRQANAPRQILNALYNAADVYVSTSAEGFGLTIAEAMACGVPAVGMHFSSVPEVIGRDRNGEPGEGAGGITVAPAILVENIYAHFWAGIDEAAMTEAIHSLVTRPKRRRELGWLANRHVTRTFTWEACAQVFHDLAAKALEKELVAA